MNAPVNVLVKRLAACLFGGFMLALMVGDQEGTLTDFGVAFRHAVLGPRIAVFLAIGVVIFLLITFRPLVLPYLARPGIAPLGGALVTVIVAQTVMNWYDPLATSQSSGKFNGVRSAVQQTTGLNPTTTWFFEWLAWTLLLIGLIGCGASIITRVRLLGWLAAAVGLVGATLSYLAHTDVVDVANGIDHSLGMYADIVGFVLLAAAGASAALSHRDVAEPKEFLQSAVDFRPGLPYSVAGVILGLLALTTDCWFGPITLNDTLSKSHHDFAGTALSSLGSQYLSWLGWTLFVVAAVLAVAATWLRHRLLAWICAPVSIVGIVLTFLTIHSMTNVGADVAASNGANWKNLGVGGYMQCIVFALFAAGSVDTITSASRRARKSGADSVGNGLPVTSMVAQMKGSSRARAILLVIIALVLFYPPMLTVVWQNVLVGQIGVFVLLSIGLNVVVGWAGLLDLGYIAFYEIGAYTTAYLTGALPRKPPEWLHMTPLLAIPFAILACLAAGVILGAPTLRLRGDYLAIVTLGFGEIIQVVALNNPGNFTGGPQGPTISHPRVNLAGLHITWGEDNLPYWYLLVIMLAVVLILFYRLEGSRLGRAWAAIREDEVAAQASGVDTTRVKLLAFAIGASTSAFAGWFFATQVGYFDPTQFTLQASILIVAYVVFGGMGSLQGAMAGAFVLTWLPQFLKSQVPVDDRQMWVGALVLAMMIFRPAGLLPASRRKIELEGLDGVSSSEVTAVPASEGL